MTLDAFTGIVAAGLLCTCFSSAMLLVWRFLFPKLALLLWGIGLGCFATAALLIALRPFLPVYVTITVQNQIFLLGYCFLWWGAAEYRSLPPRTLSFLALSLSFFLLVAWFTYINPLISMRIIILQCYGVIFLVCIIRALFSTADRLTRMEMVTVAALLLDMTMLIATMAAQLIYPDYNEPVFRNVLASFFSMSSLIIVTSFGLSFFILILEQMFNESRRAEAGIRSTKELLETIIDNIPSFTYLKDRDGRLLTCSQGLANLIGVSREQAVGKSSHDFFPADVAARQVADDLAVLRTGRVLKTEECIKSGDGLHFYETIKLPVRGHDGQITSLCGISTDITERKLMDEKLLHANEEWRRTFDAIPDMITIVDNEHRIVRANRATWQRLGCEKQDLLGCPCYKIFHGYDSPPETCPHAQLMQDGLAHSVEVYESRLDCYFDVTVSPLCEPDGKVIGSIHVAHDITEVKLAEKELEENHRFLADMIEFSGILIAVKDLAGHYQIVNRKWEEVTGLSCHEAVGRSDEELFPYPIGMQLRANDLKVIESGGCIEIEENIGDETNGYRYGISTKLPLKNKDGSPRGLCVMSIDITERKRVEDELNRKNAEIEQFIYTVSHDLRSPLVTVKTFLGYLEQDISTGDDERIVKDMEFMHIAADRMEALLDELLDVSRVGRTTILHESVTFQELAAEALDAVAGQRAAGRVDIAVSAANPTLCGDRRRLLQIWQNLLDNAIKYMGDQETPRIEIGVEQQGGETVFFICDNGIGIAPEYHEKVFGIFEKLDRKISGVGMGLTMVKRIVEMYGGQIRVESQGNGTGCCFRFNLPGAAVSSGE